MVKDVTFTHNIVRHTASAFNLLSSDNNFPSQPCRNIVFRTTSSMTSTLQVRQKLCPSCAAGRPTFSIYFQRFDGEQRDFDHNTAFPRRGEIASRTSEIAGTVPMGFITPTTSHAPALRVFRIRQRRPGHQRLEHLFP